MKTVASSAPGKLVLLGEYAVLFGHPAVVVAVNRRARVNLAPAKNGDWSVTAPGFEEAQIVFELDGTRGFRWREPESEAAGRLDLVEKVIGSLMAARLLDPESLPPASVTLDTKEFFQDGAEGSSKLGLGSSAALTVALTAVLDRWGDGDGNGESVDLGQLLRLHRSFQGGRGSGIDLAASFTGGVVEYRLTEGGSSPSARTMAMPAGLHLVFLWTGRSASTGDFLARLDDGMNNDGGEIAAVLRQLGSISAAGISNLRAGEISAFLDHVNDFSRVMEELGHAAGIPILSGEHLELRRLADDVGVSYKPSGAGGGDVGIGFADDPGRAEAFAAKAADAGFPLLDLDIDLNGVESEFLILGS